VRERARKTRRPATELAAEGVRPDGNRGRDGKADRFDGHDWPPISSAFTDIDLATFIAITFAS
jgi:hypothetical protein